MPYAQRQGYRLYYETHGSGHPLLLIRGLGSNLDHWYPQLPAFKAHYQVVTFDNQGVARSGDPGGAMSIPSLAEDAAAVLDAAGAGRAHVLGVSMGGMIAQELALNFPRRVAGLVLCATHCGGREQTPPDAQITGLLAELFDPSGKAPPDFNVLEWSPSTPPEVLKRHEQLTAAYPASLEVMRRQWAAIEKFATCGRLPGLECPTLVLAGIDDRFIPPANDELLARLIPNAKLTLIPHAAHQVLVEQPQAANQAILEFLAGV
jgi:pimeloyl-ACP methyl ester carboxylesterase